MSPSFARHPLFLSVGRGGLWEEKNGSTSFLLLYLCFFPRCIIRGGSELASLPRETLRVTRISLARIVLPFSFVAFVFAYIVDEEEEVIDGRESGPPFHLRWRPARCCNAA